MAPAFLETASALGVPSKMFQRPISAMAPSINDLNLSGSFLYQSEPEATANRFADWQKLPMIGDLASIAVKWFRRSPKQMLPSISVGDQKGNLKAVPLVGNPLAGSW